MEITRRKFLESAAITLGVLAGCNRKKLQQSTSNLFKGKFIRIHNTVWMVEAVSPTRNALYLIQNTHVKEDCERDYKLLEELVKAKRIGAFLHEGLEIQPNNAPYKNSDIPVSDEFPEFISDLLKNNDIKVFGTQDEKIYEESFKALYSGLANTICLSYSDLSTEMAMADLNLSLLALKCSASVKNRKDFFKFEREHTAKVFRERFDEKFHEIRKYLDNLAEEGYKIPDEKEEKEIIFGKRERLLEPALDNALRYSKGIAVIYGESHTNNLVSRFKSKFTIFSSVQPDIKVSRKVFSNGEGFMDDRLLEIGRFNEEISDFCREFQDEYSKALEHYKGVVTVNKIE